MYVCFHVLLKVWSKLPNLIIFKSVSAVRGLSYNLKNFINHCPSNSQLSSNRGITRKQWCLSVLLMSFAPSDEVREWNELKLYTHLQKTRLSLLPPFLSLVTFHWWLDFPWEMMPKTGVSAVSSLWVLLKRVFCWAENVGPQ